MNTIETNNPAHKTLQNRSLLLHAKGISHNFDYPLFLNTDLELHSGESIAIIGSSGCGKSTFLNILCSLLTPNHGEVLYEDTNIFSLSQKELLKLRREIFGIIFQSHYLFRGFNARENLQIAELLTPNTIDETLLRAFKIDHILSQGIGELSGGQQQRLSIARVLTKQPRIIFADEPTGNLDKQTAQEVMHILFDYIQSHNAGMILVTHEEDLAYLCTQVYRVENLTLTRLK